MSLILSSFFFFFVYYHLRLTQVDQRRVSNLVPPPHPTFPSLRVLLYLAVPGPPQSLSPLNFNSNAPLRILVPSILKTFPTSHTPFELGAGGGDR